MHVATELQIAIVEVDRLRFCAGESIGREPTGKRCFGSSRARVCRVLICDRVVLKFARSRENRHQIRQVAGWNAAILVDRHWTVAMAVVYRVNIQPLIRKCGRKRRPGIQSHTFKRRAGVARIINIQREVQRVATFSATPPHDLDFAQWWNSSRGNVNPHSGIEVDPDAFPANRNIVDGLQVGHAVKELIWLRLFRDSEPNPGSSKTRGFPKLSSVQGCCRAAAAAELGWEVRLVFSRCRAGRSC